MEKTSEAITNMLTKDKSSGPGLGATSTGQSIKDGFSDVFTRAAGQPAQSEKYTSQKDDVFDLKTTGSAGNTEGDWRQKGAAMEAVRKQSDQPSMRTCNHLCFPQVSAD